MSRDKQTLYNRDLIQIIQLYTNCSPCQAHDCLNVMIQAISDNLINGHPVVLQNFGAWHLKTYQPHMGYNPQTKHQWLIPAHKNVTFHVSKNFHQHLNQS